MTIMRKLGWVALFVVALLVILFAVLLTGGRAQGAAGGTDPPVCRLVPAVFQNSHGGQSTAWFRWCGDAPDAPSPVKLWVEQFTGDGFTFDASQCPKVNPCTIFGVP